MSLIISNRKFVITLHISSASLLISNKQKSSISSLFNVKTSQSVKLTFKAERAHCVICKIIFTPSIWFQNVRLLKWLDFDFSDSNLSNSSPNMRGRSMMAGHREGGIIRGYHRLRGNYCWHYYPKPSIRRLGHCTQCRLMITGHDAYKRLALPSMSMSMYFWVTVSKVISENWHFHPKTCN